MSESTASSKRSVVIGRRDFLKRAGMSAASALGGAFPTIAQPPDPIWSPNSSSTSTEY